MKCVEIIELRLRCNDQLSTELDIPGLINDVEKKMKSSRIKIYRHSSLENDYRLHILYNTEELDVNGSLLGLSLVSSLKEFGLINHSVWIEIDNNNVLNH